jgi:hypothetical protein
VASVTLTLRIPPDTPAWHTLPVPAGRWHRDGDGAVVAEYEDEELLWALALTPLWRVALEKLENLETEEER